MNVTFALQLYDGPPADGRLVVELHSLTNREMELVSGALHQIVAHGYLPGVIVSYPMEPQPPPLEEKSVYDKAVEAREKFTERYEREETEVT